MPKFIDVMRRIDSEAYIWMLGLALVVFIGPYSESHFSVCLFKNLGFDFCPGCGLGRSIAYLARGEIIASFNAHPLGAPAVAVLAHRIVMLVRNSLQQYH
jgi:hypothetical protein